MPEVCNGRNACCLNDIDENLTNKAAASINEGTGNTCIPFAGDAGDVFFIQKMVDDTVTRFGKIDIVIANAGITLFGDFFTYSHESFSRVLQLNLGGTFFLAQTAATKMRKQLTGGSLLFTSSVTGHQAYKDLAVYSMTKAAIEMLAKNLVIEVSKYKS